MNVELTIKGEISTLRLEPGDKILIEIPPTEHLSQHQQAELKKRAQEVFAGHEVIVADRVKVSVVRDD